MRGQFTAEQAAQKHLRLDESSDLMFTAEQAAQKLKEAKARRMAMFTAEQADENQRSGIQKCIDADTADNSGMDAGSCRSSFLVPRS